MINTYEKPMQLKIVENRLIDVNNDTYEFDSGSKINIKIMNKGISVKCDQYSFCSELLKCENFLNNFSKSEWAYLNLLWNFW